MVKTDFLLNELKILVGGISFVLLVAIFPFVAIKKKRIADCQLIIYCGQATTMT
jgi:hypothetical protein